MKDLRGISEGNVMPKRIFVDKFLQHSHLAFYLAVTDNIATFLSFLIVMSGL